MADGSFRTRLVPVDADHRLRVDRFVDLEPTRGKDDRPFASFVARLPS